MSGRTLLVLGLFACGAPGPKAAAINSPTVEQASEADELSARAQKAFVARGDRASLVAAIQDWGRALQLDPRRVDDCALFGRATQLLGETHDMEAAVESRAALFERGMQVTELCLRTASPRFAKLRDSGVAIEKAVEILSVTAAPLVYWHANNLGSYAKARGRIAGARYKDRIFALMAWVQARAPRYEYGGPDRFFGAYYAVVPSFLGGDLDKSRKHFAAAIAIAPGYPGNHLLLAEYYAVAAGDRATFDRVLGEFAALPSCVDDSPRPCQRQDWAPEAAFSMQRAKMLINHADSLF